MDCVASLYGRNNLTEVIKKAAENIFIPITVGGGIRSVENADELLHNGADKICVNTAAVKNPKLITDLSKDLALNVWFCQLKQKKYQKTIGRYSHTMVEKRQV